MKEMIISYHTIRSRLKFFCSQNCVVISKDDLHRSPEVIKPRCYFVLITQCGRAYAHASVCACKRAYVYPTKCRSDQ